jgi:hypothetical protein
MILRTKLLGNKYSSHSSIKKISGCKYTLNDISEYTVHYFQNIFYSMFSKNDIISKTMARVNVSNWITATINY